MIECDSVRFGYEKTKDAELIHGISLSIEDGEFVALTGENGAGKSTFSKLLAGILKPSDGKICVNGIDTKKVKNSMLAKTTGFLFQNPDRQLCTYTVRDEITFGQKALKTGTEEEISKRTEKIIERFGFNPDEAPFSLSRGQRQRLALASIIAVEPKVMILDEPTTGLDYKECMEIMSAVKELNKNGTTVIMVCHDMELVLDFARRMIVLADGKIKADGKTLEIMRSKKILQKASLLPPQIIQIALELEEKFPGRFNFENVRTADELAAKIQEAIK
ncbi:MAG: ABC transporter ATP-binding protein [Treponema succinifaciens]|uniref:energy-coupling factor ABC transporter ATP-binding protein n=1 Tax=Treponema succinifaciens TaxID=167 RepID=UPI0023F5706F|nr:ABC transporter ATP-binding protein [Treponema succinifaciens]MDD6963190.1 ABC transporter ATP-binding protein [Treponema succinifaciens]MDY5117952.1 ABC transporter ATP-binding protein [Treponema succinifaciens]